MSLLMIPIVIPNFTHLVFRSDSDWKEGREFLNSVWWTAKVDSVIEIENSVL